MLNLHWIGYRQYSNTNYRQTTTCNVAFGWNGSLTLVAAFVMSSFSVWAMDCLPPKLRIHLDWQCGCQHPWCHCWCLHRWIQIDLDSCVQECAYRHYPHHLWPCHRRCPWCCSSIRIVSRRIEQQSHFPCMTCLSICFCNARMKPLSITPRVWNCWRWCPSPATRSKSPNKPCTSPDGLGPTGLMTPPWRAGFNVGVGCVVGGQELLSHQWATLRDLPSFRWRY